MTQVAPMENYLKKEEKNFKEFIFETIFAQNIKPSALKSIDIIITEANQQVEQYIQSFKMDISKGLGLFRQKAHKTEQDQLRQTWAKVITYVRAIEVGNNLTELLSPADLQFLEQIAKRELMDKQYEDASCMFRFLIQISQQYSSAWVGWAVCEQELVHFDNVDSIYEMGMALLPYNFFIRIFASEYFIATDRKERAREILQRCLEALAQADQKQNQIYEEISTLLATL